MPFPIDHDQFLGVLDLGPWRAFLALTLGRVQVEESREFANQKGYSLSPKFVFIDGRTGAVLHSESFHEEALYNENLNTPALSAYFELMDKLLPGFLNTLSTQKIKGTRILIK